MPANQESDASLSAPWAPEQIMAESFRIIDAEVGTHPFETVEWQVVRRIIHASPATGFVSVVESKEQALTLDTPVITVRGRKGGSAVASATVNALLLMAPQGLAS